MELHDLPEHDLSPAAATALQQRLHAELRHQRVMRRAERLWTTQLEPALVYGAALITTSWALVRVFVG